MKKAILTITIVLPDVEEAKRVCDVRTPEGLQRVLVNEVLSNLDSLDVPWTSKGSTLIVENGEVQ